MQIFVPTRDSDKRLEFIREVLKHFDTSYYIFSYFAEKDGKLGFRFFIRKETTW